MQAVINIKYNRQSYRNKQYMLNECDIKKVEAEGKNVEYLGNMFEDCFPKTKP